MTARSAFGRRDPGLWRVETDGGEDSTGGALEGAGEHRQSISHLTTLTGSGASHTHIHTHTHTHAHTQTE